MGSGPWVTMKRAAQAVRMLLGLDVPGRHVEVRDDDRFLVSYPRSGNTWLRFLIANLLTESEVDFLTIESIIPDIYQNTSRSLSRVSSPRYLKSHEVFDPRYPKVVYLTRDPRDVCVSQYFYSLKNRWIHPKMPLSDFAQRFLDGRIKGGYGSWGENVGSWLGAAKSRETLLVIRYEDMLEDPVGMLGRIAKFLGIDSSRSDLDESVERSRLDVMKKLEIRQSDSWKPTRGTDSSIRFVREGNAGGWQNVLSSEAAGAIGRRWRNIMVNLGYEPGSIREGPPTAETQSEGTGG